MAKQQVTEKILADAKREAGEIISKYRAEALEIKKNQDEKITIQKNQIERDVEASKRIEYLRRVSQRKLELNRKFVTEKRKLIDGVIDQALKELSMHTEYLDFLKTMIKKSNRENGELIINKADWKHYGSDLEKFLKNLGCQFKITTNNEISGGIMIKKDKIMYHGSLDIIRELISDQLAIAVSKKLA
jgi:V/A-type H+-transporting ATPase subunit E